jgi:hypothetical protein
MGLTQVSTGGIKDGQIHTADLADGAISAAKFDTIALDTTYTLGASGTNHYTFTGEGLTGAVNDPTLYLTRGKTYRFVNGNSAGAHPFRIQTTVNGSAGTEYNTGVTNNGGGGGSTIIFEVPHDAPDVLYYQCTSHGSMGGIFYMAGSTADGTITTAKLATDAVTTAKIADSQVTTAKLDTDAVTGAKIADDQIDSEHYVDGSIDTAHIADSQITTAKIADVNVTTGKIANDAVTGDKLSDNLDIPDNNTIRFGTGNDLSIKHSGQHAIINNSTGNYYVQTDNNYVLEDASGANHMIHAIPTGQVELHYNGAKKIETTSTGGLVTGFLKTSLPVAFYGEQDTHHTVANNTWTTIKNLGSHPVNTTGWSESTGIFTVPSGKEGLYFLTVGAGIDDVQSRDFVNIGFAVNGTSPFIQQWGKQTYASENAIVVANMTGMVYLAAGSTIRGVVKHNEGSTEYTEPIYTWFGGFRIT